MDRAVSAPATPPKARHFANAPHHSPPLDTRTVPSPSSPCCHFGLDMWARLRLESIAMNTICTILVWMNRFREGKGGCRVGLLVDVRLPGKGSSIPHVAMPVYLIITMIKWIRTSRLSMKNSLSSLASVDYSSVYMLGACPCVTKLLVLLSSQGCGFRTQSHDLTRSMQSREPTSDLPLQLQSSAPMPDLNSIQSSIT